MNIEKSTKNDKLYNRLLYNIPQMKYWIKKERLEDINSNKEINDEKNIDIIKEKSYNSFKEYVKSFDSYINERKHIDYINNKYFTQYFMYFEKRYKCFPKARSNYKRVCNKYSLHFRLHFLLYRHTRKI